ncbi:hypothetical protein ACFL35_05655 [Candidatus Riflebacteria bacterium]
MGSVNVQTTSQAIVFKDLKSDPARATTSFADFAVFMTLQDPEIAELA